MACKASFYRLKHPRLLCHLIQASPCSLSITSIVISEVEVVVVAGVVPFVTSPEPRPSDGDYTSRSDPEGLLRGEIIFSFAIICLLAGADVDG